MERTGCGAVNRADKNAALNLENKMIVAQKSHLLVDAPDCVRKTMFPFHDGPAPTTNKTCTKVSCGSLTSPMCGDFKVDTKGASSFTYQRCTTGNKTECPVPSNPFNATSNYHLDCTIPVPPKPVADRYPGEKCDANNTCLFNKNCTKDGVCEGAAEKQACKMDIDCSVGLFCNTTNATNMCAPQLPAGSNCTTDYMCPQTQGCLNGKCTDYFSLPVGNVTNGTNPSLFCKSMKAVDNKCWGWKYGANMTKNSDGFVVCDINVANSCSYAGSDGKNFTEECQCSWDSKGRSLCRTEYDEGNKNWQKLASSSRAKFSSKKCHTMHRFGCYDVEKSTHNDIYDASLETTEAYKYHYADDCIKKDFAAGGFLQISFAVLVALLINLL
jgi:hypothetical protein